jgi:hypothetical protein
MILKHFTEHPASVDETYGEHLRFATGTGLKMVLGGLACMCHGLLPFAFVTTGSRTIIALHKKVSSGARAPIAARIRREDMTEGKIPAKA